MMPATNMMTPGDAGTAPAVQDSGAASASKESSGVDAKSVKASSSTGGSDSVADFELGSNIRIKYQHPSMGKITYEGILVEKQIEGTNHESYVTLQDCKRVSSSSGKIREREESKRLMSAFINDARLLPPPAEAPAPAVEAVEAGPKPASTEVGDGAAPKDRSRSRSKAKKEKKSKKKSAGRGTSKERSKSREG